jgi:hypothetical protein
MADYEANAELALRLIRENGRDLPMTRSVGGTYDPVAGSVSGGTVDSWSIPGIILPATFRSMVGLDNGMLEAGTLTLSKARKILAAAKGSLHEPLPEDIINFDGSNWRVLACVPLNPAGIPIVYKIGVMKA